MIKLGRPAWAQLCHRARARCGRPSAWDCTVGERKVCGSIEGQQRVGLFSKATRKIIKISKNKIKLRLQLYYISFPSLLCCILDLRAAVYRFWGWSANMLFHCHVKYVHHEKHFATGFERFQMIHEHYFSRNTFNLI